MTETVLVIGGTGELGAPVARQPRGEGYRVRLLVRTPTGTRNRDADLEYVEGDLDDTDALRRALAGCAAVRVSVRGGPTAAQYDRVEHHGPARVAQLAALAGVARLTHVSHMVSRALARPESAGTRLDVHGPQALTIADALRIYCQQLAPGTRVVTRPLWFMTVLDRTVLRGQLRGTLELMRALQHSGERRDRQRMGKPTTSGNRSSADPRGRVCSRWRP
jgi:hypothetical protein